MNTKQTGATTGTQRNPTKAKTPYSIQRYIGSDRLTITAEGPHAYAPPVAIAEVFYTEDAENIVRACNAEAELTRRAERAEESLMNMHDRARKAEALVQEMARVLAEAAKSLDWAKMTIGGIPEKSHFNQNIADIQATIAKVQP